MNLYVVLTLVSLTCIVFQLDALQPMIEWNRSGIQAGEWWRIVSGNFTHTNFTHLAMNLGALWLIAFIFKPRPLHYVLLSIIISAAIGAGILLSDMWSYVGLSGTLHGLFGYYAMKEVLEGRRSSLIAVVGLFVKVGYETYFGAPEGMASLIEARVATEAHLIGAVVGSALAFIKPLRKPL